MLGFAYLGSAYLGSGASYLPTAAAAVRVTQAALELVTQPAPAGRITQYALELLEQPAAAGRVTQYVLELLTPQPAPGRITQYALEVLTPAEIAARVSQYAIEALAGNLADGRVTQYVLEVLARVAVPDMTGWRLEIDGVDHTAIVDAFSMSRSLNDRARSTFVVGDFLPTRFDEVVSYAADGITPLFGGVLLQRNYQGRNQYDPTYQISSECGDFFTYADWCFTSLTYASDVSLRTVLVALVGDHLGDYGIQLDPSQGEGPMLSPFTWTNRRVSDALRELSDRTGYVVRISPDKFLLMFAPGTIAAPVTLTEARPNCHDLTWRDSDRIPYTKVTLTCGPGGQAEVPAERQMGDGVRRRWELYSPFVAIVGALRLGSLSEGLYEGGYNVGIIQNDGVDAYPWMVDLATNELVQRADQVALRADEFFEIWYMAAFPFNVSADTGATPVVEYLEARPDVTSKPVAQELAESLLAQFQMAPIETVIQTDVDGFEPGQALVIDLPVTRALSGTFIVTSVNMNIIQDTSEGDRFWHYQLEAIESELYQGSYLDQWRQLAGINSGQTSVTVGGGGDGGGDGGGTLVTVGAPIFLGGSRSFSLEPVGPNVWAPVPDYVDYHAAGTFNGIVRADVFARRAGVGAQVRLRNITDDVVTATGPVVTSTTPIGTSFAAAITLGKVYRLELAGTTADESVFAIGTLEGTGT